MQKTYHKQTAKFIAIVSENIPALSGAEMQHWIQHPDLLKGYLAGLAFRRVEKCPYESLDPFINHGCCDGRTAIASIRGARGFKIVDEAANFLIDSGRDRDFEISDKKKFIPYMITGKNLGIKDNTEASVDQVKTLASRMGLQYCSPVTAALYLLYSMERTEQKIDTDPLYFISHSAFNRNHHLVILTTCHSAGVPTLGISTIPSSDAQFFTSEDKFVFL